MEDRLEIWLELIGGKLDRLIELGENVERASRSQGMPEEWGEHEGDHFAGAIKTVAEESKPAWEPKVGDWVLVTRPKDWEVSAFHSWSPVMDKFNGKVGKIEGEWEGRFHICGFAWPNGLRFIFDRVWLSPAEPPASEKPPEPEYREPVLPADCGKQCEFSNDGKTWITLELNAWLPASKWVSKDEGCWQHARIKINP